MKTHKHLLILSLVLMLAAGLVACNRGDGVRAAREDRDDTFSPAEQDFMLKAAQANLAEIDLAQMAKQKGQNDDVKDYANMIEQDHRDALDDLMDIMKAARIAPPQSPTPDARVEIDRMNMLMGAEFEREFVNTMVMNHQKAVDLFRDAYSVVQNEDLREYISNKLPKIEMHLQKAHALQSKLFSGKAK